MPISNPRDSPRRNWHDRRQPDSLELEEVLEELCLAKGRFQLPRPCGRKFQGPDHYQWPPGRPPAVLEAKRLAPSHIRIPKLICLMRVHLHFLQFFPILRLPNLRADRRRFARLRGGGKFPIEKI